MNRRARLPANTRRPPFARAGVLPVLPGAFAPLPYRAVAPPIGKAPSMSTPPPWEFFAAGSARHGTVRPAGCPMQRALRSAGFMRPAHAGAPHVGRRASRRFDVRVASGVDVRAIRRLPRLVARIHNSSLRLAPHEGNAPPPGNAGATQRPVHPQTINVRGAGVESRRARKQSTRGKAAVGAGLRALRQVGRAVPTPMNILLPIVPDGLSKMTPSHKCFLTKTRAFVQFPRPPHNPSSTKGNARLCRQSPTSAPPPEAPRRIAPIRPMATSAATTRGKRKPWAFFRLGGQDDENREDATRPRVRRPAVRRPIGSIAPHRLSYRLAIL